MCVYIYTCIYHIYVNPPRPADIWLGPCGVARQGERLPVRRHHLCHDRHVED